MKKEPDYIRIYSDILSKKHPEKLQECTSLLQKKKLSAIDILKLNKKIFGNKIYPEKNKHKSYGTSDIIKILDYQEKNQLNNSELARHFELSRNTVTKWRRLYSA